MENLHPRIVRERKTIEKMAYIFCHAKHGTEKGKLCSLCQELRDYAFERLRHCPFQENKPTCANCTVHCYKPAMRERVREMMRYAGPRMLLHHPYLALMHLAVDGRRKTPALNRKTKQDSKE